MKKFVSFFYCFLLISVAMADGKNRNFFEINLPSVDEKFYPRLLLEDENNFTAKKQLGLWTLIELSGLPYAPNSWIEKGYNPENRYDLHQKVGLTYSTIYSKVIAGAGFSFTKSYLCPLLGFSLHIEKLYFQALGMLDIKPVTGFDPNSWYKMQLLYSLSNHLDMGVVSERFYGTGIVSEYNLGSVKFKFMFGKELEFDQNMYQFGLMFKM